LHTDSNQLDSEGRANAGHHVCYLVDSEEIQDPVAPAHRLVCLSHAAHSFVCRACDSRDTDQGLSF
jgi:hypothetical protein